jgi:hypothetical protein
MPEPELKRITYGQVIAEMDAIIREVGNDYVYRPPGPPTVMGRPMCYYVHEAGGGSLTPGCIVGVWLHRFHHIALATLQSFEGKSAQGLLIGLRDMKLLDIETQAMMLVLQVQKLQDGWEGIARPATWRDALTQALRLVPPPPPMPAVKV